MTTIWHRFTCWHVQNRIDANRRHVLRWFVGEIVAFKPNTLYLQTWQVLCWELLRCLFISGTKKALHGLSRAQILWENGCWSAKFQHVSSLTSSDCCYAFQTFKSSVPTWQSSTTRSRTSEKLSTRHDMSFEAARDFNGELRWACHVWAELLQICTADTAVHVASFLSHGAPRDIVSSQSTRGLSYCRLKLPYRPNIVPISSR